MANYKSVLLLCTIAAMAIPTSLTVSSAFAQDHRDERNGGQEDHGRDDDHRGAPAEHAEQAHKDYQFRDEDKTRLRQHYQHSIAKVNRDHRPNFAAGGYLAPAYRKSITRAPDSVVRYLPPPPPGYAVGYYQGYTVVYDPATFLILNVVDLLDQ